MGRPSRAAKPRRSTGGTPSLDDLDDHRTTTMGEAGRCGRADCHNGSRSTRGGWHSEVQGCDSRKELPGGGPQTS